MANFRSVLFAIFLTATAAIGYGQTLPETPLLKAQLWVAKVEKHQLQTQILKSQLEAQTAQLQAERQKLEGEFREILKPAADHIFNWETLTFTPPPPGGTK